MGLRDLIRTKIDPDEAGRVALIRVKISSGNAGFERAVLPGAAEYDCFLQKSCQVNELETSIGQKQFKKGQIKAE